MELWHALNRGVDGRDLFLDSQDYARFVHNLYEFNDSVPADNLWRLFDPTGMKGFVNPSFSRIRERLVDIHGWILMKNHYHLLLSERVEGGMSLFLRKLNVGYANYFNERYGRKGTLFQGRTKKVLVEKLERLLSDKELRAKLGASGQKTVQENYSYGAMIPRLLAILKSVGAHG